MIGIEKKRFAAAVEKILKEELQKGNIPSSKEFGLRLTKYLQSQNLGRPEYVFQKVANGDKAVSAFYNDVVAKIQKDLQILYENTIAIHEELNGKFDWFETEKNKLEYESRKLENELKEKISLYGKTGFLTSVFDVFDDTAKVETQDDVIIDVKKHHVVLKEEQDTSYVLYPSGTITFHMPKTSEGIFKRVPLTGKPQQILSSYKNESWQEIWLAKDKGPASGYLEYVFENKEIFNRIEFEVQTVKPCEVRVEFTSDNQNWFHLPYYEKPVVTDKAVSFDFPSIEAYAVRIWITKTEHDMEVVHPEGYQYQYVFGAKTLSFYQLRYPSVGTFITRPLKPAYNGAFSIGKVSLVTEEELPVGTDIEYFVAIPGDSPEWKSISPVNRENPTSPQVLDFKYITESPANSLGIPEGYNVEEYELPELTANGIGFYQIGSIEKKEIIKNTERLYAGKNAWFVKSTVRDYGSAHIPSLNDWFQPPSEVKMDFQRMETGRPSVIMQGRKHTEHVQYYYSMGIFCDEKEKVFSTTPASTEPIAIFLNGEKIFEGIPNSRTQVNYTLKNGWNDIVLLVYTQSVDTANGATVDIGFDPSNLSVHVYASSKPLKKVSVFDLQYNTKNNDWATYAFYEDKDKQYVVLNHAIPGITYDLYMDYIDQEPRDTIQLKAVFRQNGQAAYTSPKLQRYTIQFS